MVGITGQEKAQTNLLELKHRVQPLNNRKDKRKRGYLQFYQSMRNVESTRSRRTQTLISSEVSYTDRANDIHIFDCLGRARESASAMYISLPGL